MVSESTMIHFNIPVMNNKEIEKTDRENIWHPYSSLTSNPKSYIVDSAHGVYLNFRTGEKVIDGMSSWWTAIHGYNHPSLNDALQKQAEKMSHVMFGGLTHEPAAMLSKKLLELLPADLNKIFFSDSGSVAVEVAMKMAVQYFKAIGYKSKNRFMTFRNGYHGDTWHAMSVCDPENGMHSLFSGTLPKQFFINEPLCNYDEKPDQSMLDRIEKCFSEYHKECAAFIVEPVVQGAGGMKFYSPEYLIHIAELCHKYNMLLIFDEIATGFGRTGKMFAYEHAGIVPDIMCIGKALTGGTMSFAATICNNKVAEGICSNDPHLFMHGPTFMANPLACAVSLASLELLTSFEWQKKVSHIETKLKQGLQNAIGNSKVNDVRCLGAIGVIELKEKVEIDQVQKKLVERGVWLRPFGRLLYTMPPYIINDEELEKLTTAMVESL